MTDTQDERKRRIGLNEALFREVNERLQELGGEFGLDALDLVCECGYADCAQRIGMSRSEYERLRSDPTLFAVVSGHVLPEAEDVVERGKGYDVVQKQAGDPARLATETDPRSN